MAAAEIVINPASVQKLESFLNDSSYREAIENSANFNTRLCIERRLRMPFLDPQTGVAQNHCNLFMNKRQRMPGAREGQIYTYPSQRWRKARRQYLTLKTARWGWMGSMDNSLMPDSSNSLPGLTGEANDGTSNFGPLSVDAAADTDSRDGSQAAGVSKEDMSKEWFYEELAMEELDALEEPPTPSSDSDYCEEPHPARKRAGRGGRGREGAGRPGRKRTEPDAASPAAAAPAKSPRGAKSPGRGRRKATAPAALPYEVPGDADKPFGCELCGARYKTRPGLTYHYSHSHKEGAPAPAQTPAPTPAQTPAAPPVRADADADAATEPQPASPPRHEYQDSYLTFLNNPGGPPGGGPSRRSRPAGEAAPEKAAEKGAEEGGDKGEGAATPAPPAAPPSPPAPRAEPPRSPQPPEPRDRDQPEPDAEERPRTSSQKASPSPYCDFCLGDQRENKKTGTAEELVSCSDCGRSGHPTCLQFTANMIVSVRKYRWQCIECKCCSVCGTSDNDDQLLFCDDCDRGYHMYCLVPPLTTQPEGSWSCALCIRDFHSK